MNPCMVRGVARRSYTNDRYASETTPERLFGFDAIYSRGGLCMKHQSLGIWVILGMLLSMGYILAPALVSGNVTSHSSFTASKDFTELDIGFCTYLGGPEYDGIYALTTDDDDCIYLAGYTESPDFPTTEGAFDQSHNGGPYWEPQDCFVTKLSNDGQEIIYSTFIGGSDGYESVTGIAVDDEGNAYITGYTSSSDFPTTEGAYSQAYNGGETECFVAKLSTNGSELLYSTYVGGLAYEVPIDIVVDSHGNAYVAGYTESPDFPVSTLNEQESCHALGGDQDGFVFKVNDDGNSLEYSMFLGGNGAVDTAWSIALDSLERVVVVGVTSSFNFPIVNALNNELNGVGDSFISRLLPDGSFDFSTYLGGSLPDRAYGVAVDSDDDIYITGLTDGDFPIVGADGSILNGTSGMFLSILDEQGTSLEYSGILKGSMKEGVSTSVGSALIVSEHEVWISGNTGNEQFPVTENALDKTMAERKGFIVMMDPVRSSLNYSTFIGGRNWNSISGIVMDSSGNIYSCGSTDSPDLPVRNAIMSSKLGTEHDRDGFVFSLIRQETSEPLPFLPVLAIGAGVGILAVIVVVLKRNS